MVFKVIHEYGNNGFCLHISHKKVGLKKKDLLAEKEDLFEKKRPFSGKKVLCYKNRNCKSKKVKKQDLSQKKG